MLAVIGYSDSGKTTLCEEITREAAGRGMRVVFVKHTHHVEAGGAPNDTTRVLHAGAVAAYLVNGTTIIPTDRGRHAAAIDLQSIVDEHAADAILVEGWKSEGEWPRISMLRSRSDLDLLELPMVIAAVADFEIAAGVRFASGDRQAVIDFALTILRG